MKRLRSLGPHSHRLVPFVDLRGVRTHHLTEIQNHRLQTKLPGFQRTELTGNLRGILRGRKRSIGGLKREMVVKGCFSFVAFLGRSHIIWPENKNTKFIPVERGEKKKKRKRTRKKEKTEPMVLTFGHRGNSVYSYSHFLFYFNHPQILNYKFGPKFLPTFLLIKVPNITFLILPKSLIF